MTDVHSKVTRSYNMSRIRGSNTRPEITVRKYLHARGIRYLLHNKKLHGTPDLTLPKYHTVLFINGCFWHGHKGCRFFKLPHTRAAWWKHKIMETRKRDQKAITSLRKEKWKVITVWECELKNRKSEQTLKKLYKLITGANK